MAGNERRRRLRVPSPARTAAVIGILSLAFLFQGPGRCGLRFLVLGSALLFPNPLHTALVLTREDRAELFSPALCVLSMLRPGRPHSSRVRVALCFLPTPVLVGPAPPSPRGRHPFPRSGFCPGGCGFLSYLGPFLPVRWSSRAALTLPILTVFPFSRLSLASPGTGAFRTQVLRSLAFSVLPGGIVQLYFFLFWKVLVSDSWDSVFSLVPLLAVWLCHSYFLQCRFKSAL